MVAFPQAIVTDKRGRFCGFSMKKVIGYSPVHELYSPKSRRLKFPNKDYRFLVHTTQNIVRAIASVHKAGCIIGDINHSGILISREGLAILIDTDSFQIHDGRKTYHCQVGVEEYTAPELQGQSLTKLLRTENHDCFALAVLIFYLLGMGRHPFAGTDPNDPNKELGHQIRDYQFSYSLAGPVSNIPPKASLLLKDFPLEVRKAFEEAFGRRKSGFFGTKGHSAPQRPSAFEWVECLGKMQKSLKACPVNPQHFYPASSKSCPWCRIRQQSGVDYFGINPQKQTKQNSLLSLKKAAHSQNPQAECALGLRYLEGRGVLKDYQQAFQWLQQADKHGSLEATFNLGVIFYQGNGIGQNFDMARKYFLKAALSGDPDANYNLGVMYCNGDGVSQDLKQSQKYLKKAAMKGHLEAKQILNSLL
ncbi:protein kinase domain-containing protein [Lasius niger]|uniref:Protein kinase domain-containing protein n=1 Tax=Lasius niger TaxID=67767 RepID=A0A0J7KNT7_LASNI|nr:protein kinase domain-containing protein [Lasius niger]